MTKLSAKIWVAHPDAPGVELNVAPILTTLQLFDSPAGAPLSQGAVEVIRRTLRTLNLSEPDPALIPPGHMVDLYQDLHRLEDMFVAIDQQPPPEQQTKNQ